MSQSLCCVTFFPSTVLFHCYLAVCFPCQLHYSLSCYIWIFLVPFLRAISCMFPRPLDTGLQNAVCSHAQFLTQTPRCQVGCLSLLHFLFPSLSGTLFTPFPSFFLSLSLFLPLTSEINRAKLIPTFSRIMSASVVTQ